MNAFTLTSTILGVVMVALWGYNAYLLPLLKGLHREE